MKVLEFEELTKFDNGAIMFAYTEKIKKWNKSGFVHVTPKEKQQALNNLTQDYMCNGRFRVKAIENYNKALHYMALITKARKKVYGR